MSMTYQIWVVIEPGYSIGYPHADRVVVVPRDFVAKSQYKCRALEYSRILGQELGWTGYNTKITFLDDISPTWQNLPAISMPVPKCEAPDCDFRELSRFNCQFGSTARLLLSGQSTLIPTGIRKRVECRGLNSQSPPARTRGLRQHSATFSAFSRRHERILACISARRAEPGARPGESACRPCQQPSSRERTAIHQPVGSGKPSVYPAAPWTPIVAYSCSSSRSRAPA
jgi:hypothetical protein